MMKSEHKLKKWEISLIFALIFTVSWTQYLGAEQEELASDLIRLHVVANSNSDEDQALKYQIRDEVLRVAETLYEEGMTAEEAEEKFSENLPLLTEVGQSLTTEYKVTAELTNLWFPTKYYDDFALPSGDYRSLHITIGEAEGENWWCVAYPPLCMGAATETVDWAIEAGHFSQQEGEMITGDGYILKFKSLELWGNVKGFFS
ncbi:MAG: stage II sporulation protein R [Eubacteriales bacterium]